MARLPEVAGPRIAALAQLMSQYDADGKPIAQRYEVQPGVPGVLARSITPAAPGFLAMPDKNAQKQVRPGNPVLLFV